MCTQTSCEHTQHPLHVIWIIGNSVSMLEDGKIQAVNLMVRESIPYICKVADENPQASVLVRAVHYSHGAEWHIETPIPIDMLKWSDIQIKPYGDESRRDMGQALRLAASTLEIPPMSARALPPVLILVSDGQPTDDFWDALRQLLALPWGKKAVRLAIPIGIDADISILNAFIGNPMIKPIKPNRIEHITKYLKWDITNALDAESGVDLGQWMSPPK